MLKKHRLYAIFSCVSLLLIGSFFALKSQSTGGRATVLIHDRVDENKLVTLAGNTRLEGGTENDLGAVADSLNLNHMMLQLKRSPEQEQAAAQFAADLTNPKSPNFHKWISATEFGKNYGLAEADIQTISGWLESHGFTINSVYPSGMTIDFSGSAGQVRRAFHTSIHNLDVNGERHIANVSDPQIPAALAPAIAGVVSLHDFRPHKMSRPKYTFTYNRQTYWAMVPADLATIYDFNPLFAKGITGAGQTIAVVEDTNLYSGTDWTNFRREFGLTQYSSGSLTTAHPSGSGANSCSNPGVNSDDSEAILDAEWASAAAPGAAIIVASCDNTEVTFGGFIAMQNLINGSNPPSIISVSYGSCEAENGASQNASVNSLYQQAVMEGVSVFVSAGDEGAAACDGGGNSATHGIGVSGWASTPYNVAVGGTDFSDVLNSTTGTYWSKTNTSTYGSAMSYIPEIPWNDSCANGLYANYVGFSTTYGTNGFCNSSAAAAGGSGGGRRGQRWSQQLRDGSARNIRSRRRQLSGIRQAFVADRTLRHSQRWGTRHARRFDVRFGRRDVGTLCGGLLFRHAERRCSMCRSASQLGGIRRHFSGIAGDGRDSGSGQPEDGRRARQSESGVLRVGREYARRVP